MQRTTNDKASIRAQILAKRRQLSPLDRGKAETAIFSKLLSRPELAGARAVCLYASTPEEVSTHKLIDRSFAHGQSVVLPRVAEEGSLALHEVRSWDELAPGTFGVFEPVSSTLVIAKESIDVFVVPGIAFDREGYRIGWGKGFYDRLLRGVSASKIGLSFNCQLIPRLPHAEYDIQMNVIITEYEVLEF